MIRVNRETIEIYHDILTAASHGAKKTRIMYKANLCCNQLTKYLNRLMGFGLLLLDGDGRVYIITEKGVDFLKAYKNFSAAYLAPKASSINKGNLGQLWRSPH